MCNDYEHLFPLKIGDDHKESDEPWATTELEETCTIVAWSVDYNANAGYNLQEMFQAKVTNVPPLVIYNIPWRSSIGQPQQCKRTIRQVIQEHGVRAVFQASFEQGPVEMTNDITEENLGDHFHAYIGYTIYKAKEENTAKRLQTPSYTMDAYMWDDLTTANLHDDGTARSRTAAAFAAGTEKFRQQAELSMDIQHARRFQQPHDSDSSSEEILERGPPRTQPSTAPDETSVPQPVKWQPQLRPIREESKLPRPARKTQRLAGRDDSGLARWQQTGRDSDADCRFFAKGNCRYGDKCRSAESRR